jgi:hypothetical protein
MTAQSVTVTKRVWVTVRYADGTQRLIPASSHRDARAAIVKLTENHGWALNGNGRHGTLIRGRRPSTARIAATYTIKEEE